MAQTLAIRTWKKVPELIAKTDFLKDIAAKSRWLGYQPEINIKH